MKPFVFRAAAALTLRRRREEAEQRARAAAAAVVAEAESALAAARHTLEHGLARGAAEQDPGVRLWYRNWIAGRRRAIAAGEQSLRQATAALAAATARVNAAHRDVRALERLEARGRAAWQVAARRDEQKALDWLGTMRHELARREAEEER
jgi:flagellar export protein FliJ